MDELEHYFAECLRLYAEEDKVAIANLGLDHLCTALGIKPLGRIVHDVLQELHPPLVNPPGAADPLTLLPQVDWDALSHVIDELDASDTPADQPDASEGADEDVDEVSEVARLAKLRQALRSSPEVEAVRARLEQVAGIMRTVLDDSDWVKITEGDGCETWFRYEVGAPTVSIKVRGTIDAPVFNVLALANEVDLIGTIVPRVEGRMLLQVSRFKQLITTLVKVPWPLWDRDAVVTGQGLDLLEHKLIAVVAENEEAESWPHVPDFPAEPPSGAVRVTIYQAGGLIEPVDANLTRVSMVANVDPKLAVIPTSIVNFFAKHIAWYGFVLFRKAARNPSEEHRERIRTKREVYGEIEERLALFWERVESHSRSLAASPSNSSPAAGQEE